MQSERINRIAKQYWQDMFARSRKVFPLIWASVLLKTAYKKFLNYEVCPAATLK